MYMSVNAQANAGAGVTFKVPQTHRYKCENGHSGIKYKSRVHPTDVQVPCVSCGKFLTHVK
jgi:hypothetical protein